MKRRSFLGVAGAGLVAAGVDASAAAKSPGKTFLVAHGAWSAGWAWKKMRPLLRARGHAGPVFAATSGYHLPRCLLLLRMAGVPARPVPPPGADPSWPRRWYWRLREAPALPYDAALMLAARLRGRT